MAVALSSISDTTPAPINVATAVLTPKGDAALSVIRLRRQLLALDPADRAWVVDLARELVEDLSVPQIA